MKLKRIQHLQVAIFVALVCYVALSYYIFREFPFGQPMWSQPMAERRIASDKSVQELQFDLRDAAQNFSHALHVKNEMLLVFFGSTSGMICFLGWSAFAVARIKREVSIDHAA